MAVVKMKDLLEAGVHFGHRTRRWHPKMKPYIFTERNGIHIIDLQQTMSMIDVAYNRTRSVVASGGTVLFVGTKKQAQQSIQEAAESSSMPYINNRWLGGTLTNFRTIRQRVDYMIKLEQQRDRGDFERLTKKEALELNRLIARLEARLGGLREMRRLPDLVFITDVNRDDIAVKECNKLDIPIVAMVDTNCDPDPIELIIPANDDAIRAIRLISGVIAQAAADGGHMREVVAAEEEDDYRHLPSEEIREPATFLGPSTLAKIARGFDTDDDDDEAEEIEIEEETEEVEEFEDVSDEDEDIDDDTSDEDDD
ncbi:MAG: 30S ribosomal protein S2 [Anaerolineae bacterium]|nr:30S ribosomal protein S2 [Anaerolineae bacterium]MCB0253388.1 30S ribosomal protein S2 [Anaerolineae bacterium]